MAKKPSDAEQVTQYMTALQHPMKAEIETLRSILLGAIPLIAERIKWKAPSYYSGSQDMVTFGPPSRRLNEILLVFHHPEVVHIASEMLEGNYIDRRLASFKSMAEVEARRAELERILNTLLG